MKNYSKQKKQVSISLIMATLFTVSMSLISCDPSLSTYEFELPEVGSIEDVTPPEARFSSSQGEGPNEEWKDYVFSNQSTSATTYALEMVIHLQMLMVLTRTQEKVCLL